MKTREELIAFHRNYCHHYERGKGAEMVCAVGMDLAKIKHVPTGDRQIAWGPCIEGHTLADPTEHCPHWLRRTHEAGEKYADEIEASFKRMDLVMPVVAKWRTWTEQNRVEKRGTIECPVCKGTLHLSQSSYNGHVWGRCETKDCVAWME